MPPKTEERGGRGSKGKKGSGKTAAAASGAGKGAAANDDSAGKGHAAAKELQDLDDGSIQQESNIEILRAQRAAARRGRKVEIDSVREDQGIDEDDPLIKVDDGIRLEPFNMRREMSEGHFDEAGCYILNREEEKKVMDAWLDTVDQAEKTAAFQRLERLEKAKEVAESRMAALTKNFGKDEGEADEDDDDDADKEKAEGQEGKEAEAGATQAAAKKEEEEAVEDEPPEDVVAVLESLISELFPLETPTEALARFRRGTSGQTASVALPLQRLRRQRQQQRKAEGGTAAAGGADQAATKKDAKRRFSEFGYDEVTADDEQRQKSQKKLQGASFLQSEAAPEAEEKKVEAPDQGSMDTAGEEATGDKAPDADMKSASVDASAVAAAAEKAAEAEKAAAEAAAAERAESRLTRKTLHVNADAKDGSEVQAVLAAMAEDPRELREAQDKQATEVPEAKRRSPSPLPPRANESRKRAKQVDSATAERKNKIEHLTSLCDRLLERGVLVYDSTREQLAIEVRQRRGDKLTLEGKDGEGDEKPKEEHADEPTPKGEAGASNAENANNTQLVYTNQRVKSAKTTVDANASLADILLNASSEGDVGEDPGIQQQSAGLYWQYRWLANKESVYGPFDSLTMRGWAMQGCFDEERPAEIRQCDKDNNGTEECWHSWEKIDFSLYM